MFLEDCMRKKLVYTPEIQISVMSVAYNAQLVMRFNYICLRSGTRDRSERTAGVYVLNLTAK